VTKGALYYHFDNKEALGYAVVDEVMASDLHQKWVQPLRDAKNPIDALVRIVQSESLKREDVQRSCPFLNLSQEMSGIDAGFRRRTAKLFANWHDAIAEAFAPGRAPGAVTRCGRSPFFGRIASSGDPANSLLKRRNPRMPRSGK
jgi:AcrR family transcriptional regulator